MTGRFRETFPSCHAVLPVIHATSTIQALRNAEIAQRAGCDGIFLTNHSISHAELMEIHRVVTKATSPWWVGINSLGRRPVRLFAELSESVAGVWIDNAEIDERSDCHDEADRIDAARAESRWNGLYFGGVAFKYQREVVDLARACQIATNYMDVVTTSGVGTGSAASLTKIAAMKEALGEFPLAIASGITPENVTDYMGVADAFLVATGISDRFTELNPMRVKQLVTAVRSASADRPPLEGR